MLFRLLKKEFKLLFAKKLSIVLAVTGVLLLLQQYNSGAAILTLLVIVAGGDNGKEIEFCALLPVTKRQVLLSKLLFLITVEAVYLLICLLSALISPFNPMSFVTVTPQGFTGLLAIILAMFTVINFGFCFGICLGKPLTQSFSIGIMIPVLVYVAFMWVWLVKFFVGESETLNLGWGLNSPAVSIVLLCAGAVLYPLLTVLGGRAAANKFASTDQVKALKSGLFKN